MIKPSSIWLEVAIQHAKHLNAGCTGRTIWYKTLPIAKQKRINTLRRLWWCCVIRDRISPLCTRRSMIITWNDLRLERCPPLHEVDLEDELNQTSVHDPATQKQLHCMLSSFVQLCIILTDVLNFIFPNVGSLEEGSQLLTTHMDQVNHCAVKLRKWYVHTAGLGQLFQPDSTAQDRSDHVPDRIFLHAGFLGLIYQSVPRFALCKAFFPLISHPRSSRIFLWQHGLLCSLVNLDHTEHSQSSLASLPKDLSKPMSEIRDAVTLVAFILDCINQRDLQRLLSISA